MLGFAALGANPLGAVAAAVPGAAYVPAATGTSIGSGTGGAATGTGSETYTRAPSGSGPVIISSVSFRPSNSGGIRR